MFDKFTVCGWVCTPAFTYAYIRKVFVGAEMKENFYDSATICAYVPVNSKSYKLLVCLYV